ncbi:MAG: hypothetical protein IT324_19610 [Anaerolineae bacterium]|nr:hypothetical protein [Anaerolineae bacterium]
MSAPYITHPKPNRQLETLHHNLNVADHQRVAHFETDAVKIWGIDEKVYEPDEREGMIHADLTLIISLKDHRNRLNRDDMKAVARRELTNLINNKGQWSNGRQPEILSKYDDAELETREVWMMSRSTWVAHITVYATWEDPGRPLGQDYYWSERGVR